MAILTRDEILSADDIKRELVAVPEWGGDVYVKAMSGTERDLFESSIVELRGKKQQVNMKDVRAKLAACSICDEKGKRVFTDADVNALAKKSAAALQRVFTVAQRLSGIGDDDVKELAEGLQEAPFDDSPTA
jgi:hypothetical protein